jgi:hypothetical protein
VKFISEVVFGVGNMSNLYVNKIFGNGEKESYRIMFYQDTTRFHEMIVSMHEEINECHIEFLDVTNVGYFGSEITEGRGIAEGKGIIKRFGHAESKITPTANSIVTKVCNQDNNSLIKQTSDHVSLKIEGPGASLKVEGNNGFVFNSTENSRNDVTRKSTWNMLTYFIKPGANCFKTLELLKQEITSVLMELKYATSVHGFTFIKEPKEFSSYMHFEVEVNQYKFYVNVGSTCSDKNHDNIRFDYYREMRDCK